MRIRIDMLTGSRVSGIRRRVKRLAIAACVLALAGCKSFSLEDAPWPGQLGWLKNFLAEKQEVTYYPTAQENFGKGMELYVKEEWEDAGKYFEYVKTKFPHSRYAAVAELRLADSNFGREKWLDSIDAYRAFVRLHPTHDAVPYATFQIAKAYIRQIPEEWFFLPSVSERDQSAAQDAVRAFDDYLIRFPDHERAVEARDLRKQARSRLASHEWYVAGYYERQHRRGAAFRYERIADLYPDVDYAAEGLNNAAQIWEQLKDWRRARVDYERIQRDHPKSRYAARAASQARILKDRLERQPPTAQAPPSPPHAPADAQGVEPQAPPTDPQDDDEATPQDAP
jgi:outer membrane protein assembly factor BamD